MNQNQLTLWPTESTEPNCIEKFISKHSGNIHIPNDLDTASKEEKMRDLINNWEDFRSKQWKSQ